MREVVVGSGDRILSRGYFICPGYAKTMLRGEGSRDWEGGRGGERMGRDGNCGLLGFF